MSKFVSRMAFLLGLVIFAIGLMSCPIGDSGTDPTPNPTPNPNPTPEVEIAKVEVLRSPDKTDYLWGEDFASKGMIVSITYIDGTKTAVEFTDAETDQFHLTSQPSNKLILTKDGYDMELSGFVNDSGVSNSGTNISLALSVKATGDPVTTGATDDFNVNIASLNKLVVESSNFISHFYLGQKLPVGNTEIAAAGIQVKGVFVGKSNPETLPKNIKLAVQLENNGSDYADIGGKQPLEVIVIGLSLEIDSQPIETTVHILNDAPNNTYASGASYPDNNYIGMAAIPGATVSVDAGIGTGPFKESKLESFKDALSVQAFQLGQYEVTYELWYAVYKWATTKKEPSYVFSSNTELGILTRDGPKGTLPTAEGNDKYMPVHGINWIDAIVWCNAYNEVLNEISGTTTTVDYPYLLSGTSSDDPIKDVSKLYAQGSLDTSKILISTTTGYRLPSETEWEVAVRGGGPNSGAWLSIYAGNNNVEPVAWYDGNSDNRAHSPFESNGLKGAVKIGDGNLYNMSGNVWEWCQSNDSIDDPRPYYLKRGGAYNDAASYSSNDTGRVMNDPIDTDQDTGFRLAKTTM